MTSTRFDILFCSVFCLILAGCAVGPDFVQPTIESDAGYLAGDAPTAGRAVGLSGAALAYGDEIPGRWWELFQDKKLDALMAAAIAANPDLASARAAVRNAEETTRAEEGGFFPSVSASASGQRGEDAGSTGTGVYDLFNGSIEVSYGLDLFGGTRRQVEAARAAAEAQAFEAEATYLTLTASLADAVIAEASLRARIAATEDIVRVIEELLGVLDTQVKVGTASEANLLQQRASLAQTRASLPGLRKSLAQQRNQIAVLSGRMPNAADLPTFALGGFRLPNKLPVSLPADLVRQRPDVRQAEALLHQASANVGVATADMLPKITLSAAVPTSAGDLAKLFDASSAGWSLAASLSQPLFQGGRLVHDKRAAEAAYEAAAANYRSVVLGAFRDVADALRAIQYDADADAAYRQAEAAARASLDLNRSQYTTGTGSYVDVLTAQQTYQQARIDSVAARAARYSDVVALFEALGGGWWNRLAAPVATPTPGRAPAAPAAATTTGDVAVATVTP